MKPARHLGWIAWVILAIFLLGLIIVGWLYLEKPGLFDRWLRSSEEPPDKTIVIQQLNQLLDSLHTFGSRIELVGGRADNPDSQFRLVLTDGKLDLTNRSKISAHTIFIAEANEPQLGKSFKMSGEIRLIDKVVYLKLNQIPNLGLPALQAVESQWLRLDTVNMSQQTTGTPTTTPNVAWGQIFAEGSLWHLGEYSGAEILNSGPTYRYQLTVKRDAFSGFFERFGNVEVTEGEIWLDQVTAEPRQIVLRLTAMSNTEADLNASASLIINLRDFNEPVTITTPENVNDLGNLFDSLTTPTAP